MRTQASRMGLAAMLVFGACNLIPIRDLKSPGPETLPSDADGVDSVDGVDDIDDIDDIDPTAGAEDADGDGIPSDKDCDDSDAAVGGSEVPYDGVDNDCDGSTPDDDLDADGLMLAEDCDDADPVLGGPEVADDGLDNDCDSATDCDDTDLVHGEWEDDVMSWDVTGFCEGYDCRRIAGNLTLQGSSRTDLSPLSCLTAVDDDIVIMSNGALTSLDGLEGLTFAGSILIMGNDALTDVFALYNLTSVDDDVTIMSNAMLTDEAAQAMVDEIDTIGGDVFISND